MDDDSKKPRFELGVDTQALIRAMKAVPIGETITYAELEDVIKRPVMAGTTGYGALASARRYLEREDFVVFETITKTGLKRLDDIGKLRSGKAIIQGIGRRARKARTRLQAVDYDALPEQAQREHNAAASVLGALALMAKPSSAKKLEDTVTSTLPTAETLKLFAK